MRAESCCHGNSSMDAMGDRDKSFKVRFLAKNGYVLADTIGLGNYAKVKQAYDKNHHRSVSNYNTVPVFVSSCLKSRAGCFWPGGNQNCRQSTHTARLSDQVFSKRNSSP